MRDRLTGAVASARWRSLVRLLGGALAAGTVLGFVLVLDWGALAAVWGQWWHRPVTDERLWGLPIFWWGRIGKLLQLCAAVASVLDLIGPERLRRWGERATVRVRAARARTRTYREASYLLSQLGAAEKRVKDDLALIGAGRLELAGIDEPPAGLDLAAYRDLLTEVLDAFGGKVHCGSCHDSYVGGIPAAFVSFPDRHELLWGCLHGRGVLEPLVENAVRNTWTADQDAAFRAAEGIHRRTSGISCLLGVALVAIFAVLLVVGRIVDPLPPWGVPVIIFVVYPVIIFISALAMLSSQPGDERVTGATFVGLWATGARGTDALARAIAYLLDRTRPGHPILFVSVIFLVIGFHFDLLAG